jgi:hypothetical protein
MTETVTKKWTTIKPAPNRAKLQEVSHWILEPTRLQRRYVELRGIIGEPDTEDRTSFENLVGAVYMPEVAERVLQLAEKHNWTVSKHNADAIIADFKQAYQDLKQLMPVKDLRISRAEQNQRDLEQAKRKAEDAIKLAESQRLVIANRARLDAIMPSGAKRVIFAEHDIDDSDSRSDYYSSHTDQWAVIGFGFTTKEDFQALRAAAAGFEPTRHLGPDAVKSVEHRDNYSMGAGNYLKAGGRDSGGWCVRSQRLPLHDSLLNREIRFEYAIPEQPSASLVPAAASSDIVTLSHNKEKDGVELRFPAKPSDAIRQRLKDKGWRWSRFSSCWYARYSLEQFRFAMTIASDSGSPTPDPEPTHEEPSTEGDAEIPPMEPSAIEQTQDAPETPACADAWQEEEINSTV